MEFASTPRRVPSASTHSGSHERSRLGGSCVLWKLCEGLRPARVSRLGGDQFATLALQRATLSAQFAAFQAQHVFVPGLRAVIHALRLPIARCCPEFERCNLRRKIIYRGRLVADTGTQEAVTIKFSMIDHDLGR